MKIILASLIASASLASIAVAQSTSPASSASTNSSSAARTDIYHVHMAKAAVGKAAEYGESFNKQAPDAPMPGHYIVLRHMNGDSWDYCVIEHFGTKYTIDAARPAPSPAGAALSDWHTDTL